MNTLYIVLASLFLLSILGHLHRVKRAKNKIICVSESNCTGCKRCVKRCGHKVLDMVNDETGLHVAVKSHQKCTACGNCVAVCKFNALKIVEQQEIQSKTVSQFFE